jgi:hypothetical protein
LKPARILVLLAACWSLSAVAAPPSDASIEELLTLTRSESMVDGLNANIEQMMRAAMAETAQRERLSPTQQRMLEQFPARLAAILREESNWSAIKPDLVAIYREVYTQDELDAQLAFYRSPGGQAMIDKMPQVLQQSMAMGERQMRRLMPRLQAALKEAAAEAKAAR